MALKLYANTFQIALSVNPADKNAWKQIYGNLCDLREALVCRVCRKLINIPIRPAVSECEHNICKYCVGRKKRMKRQCDSCSDCQNYEENIQLRILLQCYKRMCKFILTSGILRNWRLNNLSSSRKLKFASFVYEGAALDDNYHYISSPPIEQIGMDFPASVVAEYQTSPSQSANGQSPVHTTELVNCKSPKVVIKKTFFPNSDLVAYYDSSVSWDSAAIRNHRITEQVKKGCSCSMGTKSKTCFGQKCPCFAADVGCTFCSCKGCSNPKKKVVHVKLKNSIYYIPYSPEKE